MRRNLLVLYYSIRHYSLCDRYDNIASKVYEDPESTENMVELVQFLAKVRADQ